MVDSKNLPTNNQDALKCPKSSNDAVAHIALDSQIKTPPTGGRQSSMPAGAIREDEDTDGEPSEDRASDSGNETGEKDRSSGVAERDATPSPTPAAHPMAGAPLLERTKRARADDSADGDDSADEDKFFVKSAEVNVKVEEPDDLACSWMHTDVSMFDNPRDSSVVTAARMTAGEDQSIGQTSGRKVPSTASKRKSKADSRRVRSSGRIITDIGSSDRLSRVEALQIEMLDVILTEDDEDDENAQHYRYRVPRWVIHQPDGVQAVRRYITKFSVRGIKSESVS